MVEISVEHYGRMRETIEIPLMAGRLNVPAAAREIRALAEQRLARGIGMVILSQDQLERAIRAEAERIWEAAERTSRVVAEVRDDGTGCGYEASAWYEATGRETPRRAHEGGAHRGARAHALAAEEAEERALRAVNRKAKRIVRRGYDASEVG